MRQTAFQVKCVLILLDVNLKEEQEGKAKRREQNTKSQRNDDNKCTIRRENTKRTENPTYYTIRS